MSVTISSPNIEDTESLYGKYIEIPGNDTKSIDDFYAFLSIESPDRGVFLDTYCIYEFIEVENTVILKFSLKK